MLSNNTPTHKPKPRTQTNPYTQRKGVLTLGNENLWDNAGIFMDLLSQNLTQIMKEKHKRNQINNYIWLFFCAVFFKLVS